MATATPTKNLGELNAERCELEAQIRRGAATEDTIERLEAETERPGLLLQIRKLDLAIEKQRTAAQTARDLEREQLHADFDRQKAARAARLLGKLREAQSEMLAFHALEVMEHTQTGDFQDFLSWVDFLPSAPDGTFEGRLDALELAMRARGWLTDAPSPKLRG